jgi:hypothetical protein
MDVMNILKSLGDRVLGWALIALGALLLLLGYLGVRGTAYVVEQLPYVISGGLGGIFLLGLGAMLLLSADLRDQWRALIEIRDEIGRGQVLPDELFVDEPASEVPAPRTRR